MVQRRIGLKGVAAAAGVSVGTVSHVLNHPERVSAARRAAVEQAIADLGFVRDESARRLRAGYSNTIGLLLLDAWNPAFAAMAMGVEDSAARAGMTLFISNSAREITRESAYLRVFAEHRVAGAIVVPHDPQSQGLHQVRAGGVPVVILDRTDVRDGVVSVGVDDRRGGEIAASHLLDLGHTRLAFAGDTTVAAPVVDRLAGFADTAAGRATLTRLPCPLSIEGGRTIADQVLSMQQDVRPSAVQCAVDVVAVGLLHELQRRGVCVPEDLSVVGYDDIPLAAELTVPLTTIARPHYEMGLAAFGLLESLIAGQPLDAPRRTFTPRLVERASTTAPAGVARRG